MSARVFRVYECKGIWLGIEVQFCVLDKHRAHVLGAG